MSQELQDYIAQARKVGKSDEEIVKGLLNGGWSNKEIQNHLNPNVPAKNQHKTKVSWRKLTLSILTAGLMFVTAMGPGIVASLGGGPLPIAFQIITIYLFLMVLVLISSIISQIAGKGMGPVFVYQNHKVVQSINKIFLALVFISATILWLLFLVAVIVDPGAIKSLLTIIRILF